MLEHIVKFIEKNQNVEWGNVYNVSPSLTFEIKDISSFYIYDNQLKADLKIKVNKNLETTVNIKILKESKLLKDILDSIEDWGDKKIILVLNDVSYSNEPNNGDILQLPSNEMLNFDGGEYRVKFIDNYLSEETMKDIKKDEYYDHSQAMIMTNLKSYDSFKVVKINYLIGGDTVYRYDYFKY